MVKALDAIINGECCNLCGNSKVYHTSDGRIKCGSCGGRYSLAKLGKDFELLHYFSLEVPANKVAMDLEFSYKKVHLHYMKYRQEIVAYLLATTGENRENKDGLQQLAGFSGFEECNGTCLFGIGMNSRGITTVGGKFGTPGSLMSQMERHFLRGCVYSAEKMKSFKSFQLKGKFINEKGRNGKQARFNAIERFWSFAKERLLRYRGIRNNNFIYYLKELEFRYNNRKENMFLLLVKLHMNGLA